VRRYAIALLTKLTLTHPYGVIHGGYLNVNESQERYREVVAEPTSLEQRPVEEGAPVEEEEEGEEGEEEDESAILKDPGVTVDGTVSSARTRTSKGSTSFPAWLSPVRPRAEDPVIPVRRECQVVLYINFKELSSVTTRKSLVIPSTVSVRTEDYYVEGEVVHLSMRVFGADTQSEYKSVCNECSKREGKKKGNPSLIDFYAASNVIKASNDGMVQVKFQFSCSPEHQSPNESAYS